MFLYFFSQCIYCLVLFLARLVVPFRLGIRKRYPNSLFLLGWCLIFNPLVVDGWFSKYFPGCGCMDVVIGFVLD